MPFKEMGKKTYFDKVVIKGVRPVLDPRWPAPFSELLRSCWHEDKNARPSFAEITTHLAQLVKDEEATVRENNNHCVVRCASGTLYYVHLLRPLCFVVSLLLLGAAFAMTTAKQAEVDNYVPGAAILAAVSALVVYASALSYLCDAWPLVPLLDPAAKLNFSIDEEGSHLHSPITGSKNNKKKKSQQEAPDAGIELTMTAIKCSVVETEMEAKPDTKESLFGAARKANNKGILSNKKSAATAGAGGEGAAAEGAAASEDLEMGGYRNQPRSGSSKGILGSLQKVARGRANKQQKRDDISGAENVTFSPLSSMSDV